MLAEHVGALDELVSQMDVLRIGEVASVRACDGQVSGVSSGWEAHSATALLTFRAPFDTWHYLSTLRLGIQLTATAKRANAQLLAFCVDDLREEAAGVSARSSR